MPIGPSGLRASQLRLLPPLEPSCQKPNMNEMDGNVFHYEIHIDSKDSFQKV